MIEIGQGLFLGNEPIQLIHVGGGGGAGLDVDFTGLPAEVEAGETISLTADQVRDLSAYITDNIPPTDVVYASPNIVSGSNVEFSLSKVGTQNISLLQGDIASQEAGVKTKQILVKEASLSVYVGKADQANAIASPANFKKINSNSSNLILRCDVPPVNVRAVATDEIGNAYVGGIRNSTDEITTIKFDSDGNLIWSVDHGNTVITIAVDKDGNVYTGGNRASNLSTRKYDSNGNLIWSVDHGQTVNDIAVDNDGNVYTGGFRISNLTTRKYDSDGDLIWSVDHGSNVNAIAVDASGNVYTGGNRTTNITTRKYDTNGNLIWSIDHGQSVWAIAVDDDGNVYTGGNRASDVTTRKYDSDGNLIWSVDHGNIVNDIAVDKEGNVYTAGNRTTQAYADANENGQRVTTRKYDSDGDLIWSEDSDASTIGIDTVPPNKSPFLS